MNPETRNVWRRRAAVSTAVGVLIVGYFINNDGPSGESPPSVTTNLPNIVATTQVTESTTTGISAP